MNKLTQTELQKLFELACQHWLSRNWDEAIAAEMEAEEMLKDYKDGYAIWRDLIDYLEVFYQEQGRGMIYEEAVEWLGNQGMAEMMPNEKG